MEILEQPYYTKIGDKIFCLAHGDGLDKSDKKYLFLKSLFHNKFLQRLFSNIHPRWAFALANSWSKHNRLRKRAFYNFKGAEDSLYKFICEQERLKQADYFLFGHLHTPGEIFTPAGGVMYVLGEWINGCDYLLYEVNSNTMEWRSGKI